MTAGEEDSLCTEWTIQEMSVLRAGLDKPLVVQLHSTSEMNLNEEAHDDPIVNLELIMQEEDWVNHGKDEEFVDPEMVALAKQEEVHEFEKLKVCVFSRKRSAAMTPEDSFVKHVH